MRGLEYCAMVTADQLTVVVGQKSVWRPVEGTTLVRANIEPGLDRALVPCGDQEYRPVVLAGFQLPKLALDQRIGLAKELARLSGVCTFI